MTKRKEYDCLMSAGRWPVSVWEGEMPGFTVSYHGRYLTYYLSDCPHLADLHEIALIVHRRIMEHAAEELAHWEKEPEEGA